VVGCFTLGGVAICRLNGVRLSGPNIDMALILFTLLILVIVASLGSISIRAQRLMTRMLCGGTAIVAPGRGKYAIN
jgi:hypothetical protein